MKRWKPLALCAAAVLVAIFTVATFYHFNNPEANCKTSTTVEMPSPDGAYKASLLEKNCNQDETIFYSVRIEKIATHTSRGWFVSGFELENDQRHMDPPMLAWVAPRRLEVSVGTRTLNGSLLVHVGEDLIFVRNYLPREPTAFPNFN